MLRSVQIVKCFVASKCSLTVENGHELIRFSIDSSDESDKSTSLHPLHRF